MKRISSVMLAFAMLFSLMACSPGNSTASQSQGGTTQSSEVTKEKSFVLKLSDQNAENTSTNIWANKFAELIDQKTNGTVKVEIYPNASLTAYDIEPLQSGICDFLQYVPSSAADLDPRLGAFDAPYIYESEAHRQAAFNYENEPLKQINESLKDGNVVLLGSFCSGYRQITCNFPINSLADIKGAKIRVVPSPLYISLFEEFGAAATPMNFTEVSTALITNVIDGQENPITVVVQNSLYEIQKYMMLTNHMPTNHGLWMNYSTLNKLSENQQKACWEAAREASLWMDDQIKAKEAENKQLLIDKGMTIIDESNGLKVDEFKTAAMKMYEIYGDKWGDMVDTIKAVKY